MKASLGRPGRGLLLLPLFVLAGCATPASRPAQDAGAVTAPVLAASASAAPAVAHESGPAATTPASAARTGKPPPGFKARKRNGELVYCRTVQVTGSQFPQEQCWPPEQVEAALAKQKESSQRLLRQQRGCRGTECAQGPPTR